MLLNARRIVSHTGEPSLILLAMQDISTDTGKEIPS